MGKQLLIIIWFLHLSPLFSSWYIYLMIFNIFFSGEQFLTDGHLDIFRGSTACFPGQQLSL